MNTQKTLLALLVEYLPNNGGWPHATTHIGQDYDRELMFYGRGNIRTGIVLDDLAIDHRKLFESGVKITREQYEAALAESKHCVHDWIPSEGRTASGYLCRKCGDYNGPESESKADADGWIDWAGGECPVECGALVEVQYRNEKAHHIKGANRAGVWCWTHDNNDGDIIAYRLHQPQEVTEADDETDLNECIGQTPAPVWNGEGLPPVGAAIEWREGRSIRWYKGTITAIGEQLVIIKDSHGEEGSYSLEYTVFRPANFERDELERDLIKSGEVISFRAKKLAQYLIDAGYRKQ